MWLASKRFRALSAAACTGLYYDWLICLRLLCFNFLGFGFMDFSQGFVVVIYYRYTLCFALLFKSKLSLLILRELILIFFGFNLLGCVKEIRQ